jgi:hypothetical protein
MCRLVSGLDVLNWLKMLIKSEIMNFSCTKCRFLLARLQMDHILSSRSPMTQVANLTTIPADLFAAYDKVVQRIHGSGRDGDKDLAMIVMSWVYHARRILMMDELLEAIAVEQNSQVVPIFPIEELDTVLEYQVTPDDIVECCRGLILFEESSKSVRFTHETVKEFIKRRELKLLSPSRLSEVCLIYLGSNPFDSPCTHKDSLLARMETYKFSRYAAQHWGDHAQGDAEIEVQPAILRAFMSFGKRESMGQIQVHLEREIFENSIGDSLLHIIVRAQLKTICLSLLSGEPEDNYRYI